jgi:hypothetical protein
MDELIGESSDQFCVENKGAVTSSSLGVFISASKSNCEKIVMRSVQRSFKRDHSVRNVERAVFERGAVVCAENITSGVVFKAIVQRLGGLLRFSSMT